MHFCFSRSDPRPSWFHFSAWVSPALVLFRWVFSPPARLGVLWCRLPISVCPRIAFSRPDRLLAWASGLQIVFVSVRLISPAVFNWFFVFEVGSWLLFCESSAGFHHKGFVCLRPWFFFVPPLTARTCVQLFSAAFGVSRAPSSRSAQATISESAGHRARFPFQFGFSPSLLSRAGIFGKGLQFHSCPRFVNSRPVLSVGPSLISVLFDLFCVCSCGWIVAGRCCYSSWVTGWKDSRIRGLNCSPAVISRMRPPVVRWNNCEDINYSSIRFLSSISHHFLFSLRSLTQFRRPIALL
jgi:hypothetical protein